MSECWDVVVVGAGHAGCEAALACARMGLRTALLTLGLDTVAQMSCNPAIGGLAKGQLVREVDALGGEMAKVTDAVGIQFRMLNTRKGPAVQAPRAQADRAAYRLEMKHRLEREPRLALIQDQVEALRIVGGRVAGVLGLSGHAYRARAVILTTGTFLRGVIHIGETHYPGGRAGEPAPQGLSRSLEEAGIEVARLKTGTPPRVNALTVDFDRLTPQHGDPDPAPFSFSTERIAQEQVPCYITYTNERTHEIIRSGFDRAPLFTGRFRGRGPRHCPSIEDKVATFPDRPRHQLFLEPEGRRTTEMYVNGLFTSLPSDIQEAMIHSVVGLERAQITRYGYAIEYDFCPPTQLHPTLESKVVEGLFCAGQINGTSGYEEAAAQGIVAGVNAGLKLRGEPSLVLGRDEAYIGVLIDDLVTKGTDEPYRMFTSRAEYRLLLRHANADRRLMRHGHRAGLIRAAQMEALAEKERAIADLIARLEATRCGAVSLADILRRPGATIEEVIAMDPRLAAERWPRDVRSEAETEIKYAGYIARQQKQVERFHRLEDVPLPEALDYRQVAALSREAKEKLGRIRPRSLGQASRISGITPSDVAILMIHLRASGAPTA